MFSLTTYLVKIARQDWDEILYTGFDEDKAKSEYESASLSDLEDRYHRNTDLQVVLEKKTDSFEFVKQLDEDETITDYPIEDFYEDSEVFELVNEGYYEDMAMRPLAPINQKTDEVLYEVQKNYDGKYTTIDLDEGGNFSLKLRIADHHGKWKNKGLEDYFLSIVIAEESATKHFVTSGPEGISSDEEFYFDSNSSAEEIIEFIDEKIIEFKAEVKEIMEDKLIQKINAELARHAADPNYMGDESSNQIFEEIKALTGYDPADHEADAEYMLGATPEEILRFLLAKLQPETESPAQTEDQVLAQIEAQIKESCSVAKYTHLCQRTQTAAGLAYVVNRCIELMGKKNMHLSAALAALEAEEEGID